MSSSLGGHEVEVARVLGPWGVKGWVKVHCFGASPDVLLASKRWSVRPAENALAVAADFPATLQVVQAREHGSVLVAQIHQVVDRSQAMLLKGARVFMDRAQFAPTQVGEYYWVDLIGLAVINREGQGLGAVAGLIDTGAHSVLRLTAQPPATEERLIPFVAAYIDDVDLAGRRILVDWGLDY